MADYKYCFDTNVIFDLWKEEKGRFPKDILPGLWEHFNVLVNSGRMVSVIDVYEELMKEEQEDKSFKEWLKDNKKIFLEVDDVTSTEIEKLVNKYNLLASGHKNAADPVIACYSKANQLVVFTTENNPANSSLNIPRLPNLCTELNIRCMGVWDFCRAESLQFKL